MILTPVPGNGIQEKIAHVQLVSIKRQAPDGTVILDLEDNLADRSIRDREREKIPHLARIPAMTGDLKLHLSKNPVPRELLRSTQRQTEAQQNVRIASSATSAKVEAEHGEGDERCRLRYMLVPQLCKSMIRRNEQIIAADVIPVAKGRPVSSHSRGQLSPPLLSRRLQALPCPDSPAMQIQTDQLLLSPGELCIWF